MMKLNLKRILVLGLSMCMIMSSLAGCSKSNNDSSSKSTSVGNAEATTAPATTGAESDATSELTLPLSEDKVTLTMYVGQMDGDFATVANEYNDSKFFQELEKRTNVHIEFTVGSFGGDAFNLMIASGELTDLICGPSSYADGLDAGVDDGLFLDLTPYLDTYLVNYNKIRTADENTVRDTVTDDGRAVAVYGINQSIEPPSMGLMIRKDWLDDLGLEIPHTVAEWETVLTAFKNEKGAYAPLALCGELGAFSGGFNVASSAFLGSFMNVDGKVMCGDNSDNMKAFITVLADWYKKGLVDPDFMTKQNQWMVDTAMVITGQTGAFYSMAKMADMYKAASGDPNFNLVAVNDPVLNEGDEAKLGFNETLVNGASIGVSADSKNKE
ncbi:MAG: extracellular solute-binding protein, partial [Suipraeoptans sp.]